MKRLSKQEIAANDIKALAEIILLIFIICILTWLKVYTKKKQNLIKRRLQREEEDKSYDAQTVGIYVIVDQ